MPYIFATYRKGRPASEYKNAIVLDAQGKLAEISEVYYREHPPAYMAKLRRFCGDDAGEQVLATLRILDRSWKPSSRCTCYSTVHSPDYAPCERNQKEREATQG